MKNIFFIVATLFSSASVFAHEIGNFHEVVPGVYRGARPEMQDLNDLKQNGFRTIINIEDDNSAIEKEKAHAEKININFYNYKMSANKTPKTADVNAILNILSDPNQQPVFLHCKHGRDRTGMVFGVFRVEQNDWTPNTAYQEMKDLGFRTFFYKLTNYFKKRTGYSSFDLLDYSALDLAATVQ